MVREVQEAPGRMCAPNSSPSSSSSRTSRLCRIRVVEVTSQVLRDSVSASTAPAATAG